ncbi:MAG: hypothetical protein JST64_14165, partial [Actinobacteria bacterium]|nr:hypothetical protein [Actinomycetota bacterium]
MTPSPDRIRRELSGSSVAVGRKLRNRVATVAMALAFVVAAVPLALMTANVLSQGLPAVLNVDWWTKPIPADVGRADLANNERMKDLGFGDTTTGGADAAGSEETVVMGMQPAIVGTVLTVVGASAMAIPLGIMGAVYLNEYGRQNRLARLIRFMTDVMTGVPSVIMGVFIYAIWVLRFGVDGKSAFAAALAL